MERMIDLPDWLRIPINRYGFILFVLMPAVIIALLLGIGGYTLVDAAIIVLMAVGVYALWWKIHARETPNIPNTSDSFMESLQRNGKYAMLAFESEFCLSSSNVGSRLAELEKEYPERFQIYALSIFKNPGKEMYDWYRCRVTPTYILLDPNGKVVMDWPLVLPVERVSYAVSQQLTGQTSRF
jgi:thioredoxin-related protein